MGRQSDNTWCLEHTREQLSKFLTTLHVRLSLIALQLNALSVPENSPLRNSHSLFWEARTNDEGKTNPYRFHGLVAAGKIKLIAPNRVEKFGSDGHSVVLSDGTRVEADAVVVATGFKSSWGKMFDRKHPRRTSIVISC